MISSQAVEAVIAVMRKIADVLVPILTAFGLGIAARTSILIAIGGALLIRSVWQE